MRENFIIRIPGSIDFRDLKVRRESDGAVSFERAPLLQILDNSGIPRNFLDLEENVTTIVNDWYAAHRRRGGDPDLVIEDLILEAKVESARGQKVSHQRGRA